MKPTELRIGNLISFKNLWNGEVEAIKSATIDIKGNDGIFPNDVFRGIKLNEEWLIKFGFKKIDPYNYILEEYESRDHNFTIENCSYNAYWPENTKGWLLMGSWEGFNRAPIKYVHQLQNLYFSLTGRELIVHK